MFAYNGVRFCVELGALGSPLPVSLPQHRIAHYPQGAYKGKVMNELVEWFLGQPPSTQTVLSVVGLFLMRESLPFLWRLFNRQQSLTDKALDNATQSDKVNSQLIDLLTKTLSKLSQNLERLEAIGADHQSKLTRIDETTQSTRKELQNANIHAHLQSIEEMQRKQNKALYLIFQRLEQTGA